MSGDEALRTALLDLLNAVPDLAPKLLVGGGYGLFIRQEFLTARAGESGMEATLYPVREWPTARSTQDIDVFVGAEQIVSRPDFDRLAGGLEAIRFASPEGVRAWKWERGGGSQKAEFDVLAPGADEYDPARVSQKGHRIQPAEPQPARFCTPMRCPERSPWKKSPAACLWPGVSRTGGRSCWTCSFRTRFVT